MTASFFVFRHNGAVWFILRVYNILAHLTELRLTKKMHPEFYFGVQFSNLDFPEAYLGTTRAACKPLGPSSIENSTNWPFSSRRKPSL
jgi:hypothetical protein